MLGNRTRSVYNAGSMSAEAISYERGCSTSDETTTKSRRVHTETLADRFAIPDADYHDVATSGAAITSLIRIFTIAHNQLPMEAQARRERAGAATGLIDYVRGREVNDIAAMSDRTAEEVWEAWDGFITELREHMNSWSVGWQALRDVGPGSPKERVMIDDMRQVIIAHREQQTREIATERRLREGLGKAAGKFEWMRRAACIGLVSDSEPYPSKKVCQACPVRQPCSTHLQRLKTYKASEKES